MKLEFSRQVFEKQKLKYQVSSKFVQWEPSCFMRTDGHYEANSRFSQFCERAKNEILPLTKHVKYIYMQSPVLHVSAVYRHPSGNNINQLNVRLQLKPNI